jgi:hypothetical protein
MAFEDLNQDHKGFTHVSDAVVNAKSKMQISELSSYPESV